MSQTHPCGLTTLAVRQHETGSRPLGKAGRLALENWQKSEELKAIIAELKKENALLKRLNSNKA